VKLLADENLDGRLIRALLRRLPEADIVRAIDVGLTAVDDPTVLEWAAGEGRVVATHDLTTMIGFALDRVSAGRAMPGIIGIALSASIREASEDLALLISASQPGEWQGRILFIPL